MNTKNKLIISLIITTIFIVGIILFYSLRTKNEPELFDDMGRQLSENFLKENKIKATYKTVMSGNNYYKYFKESKEVTKANGFAEDLLPAKLKNFIQNNCPEKIYTPNNNGEIATFDKYTYQLNEKEKYNRKFIEILVDNPASEVVCFWVYDEKTGSFDKIN